MILIIANKKNNSSIYVPVDKLRSLRVYEECDYGWNHDGAGPTKKEIKWSLEMTVDNEECLCITVGEEEAARKLANQIPDEIHKNYSSCSVVKFTIEEVEDAG